MAATPRNSKETRYRCLRDGIDKIELTLHLTGECVAGSLVSTIATVNRAMRNMNLSTGRKPDGYRDARAYWTSKGNNVSVALEKNGFETKLRFQSMGAVVRRADSLRHYRRFREVLDRNDISTCGEQIKQVDFALDFPPNVFSSINRYRTAKKYGNTKSRPLYQQQDYESIRFGSDERSHVVVYHKLLDDQPDVCRIEFRVQRNILDACGIQTVADLCEPSRRSDLESRLNKVARLTTVNPRTVHHTKVKTAPLWKQVKNNLALLLKKIAEAQVPESPPERKISIVDIQKHARSIEGSFLGLCRSCVEHAGDVSSDESTTRISELVSFLELAQAILASNNRRNGRSLWSLHGVSEENPVLIAEDHHEMLRHLRCDIAQQRIEALQARLTDSNELRINRRCHREVDRVVCDLERLNQIVQIKAFSNKH